MKNIVKIITVCALCVTACQTPNYSNKDFTKDHKSFAELDPAGYATYLEGVRDFKDTDHLVTMAGVIVPQEAPSVQAEHLTTLPDSLDYVIINNIEDISPEILEEVDMIEQVKRTKTLGLIDLNQIVEKWENIQEQKVEAGEKPGSEKAKREYIKTETIKLLDIVEEDNLFGIVFSSIGEKSDAFWTTIENWKMSNEDKIVVFRGVPGLVPEKLITKCRYIIISAGTSSSIGTLNGTIGRLIRFCSVKKNILVEVTVPSMDSPKQVGATPEVAAEFAVEKQNNRKYQTQGIVVANADKDYYRKDKMYRNVRKAITILNSVNEEEK